MARGFEDRCLQTQSQDPAHAGCVTWASHLVCEPRELIQSYLATISSRIRRPCIKAHRVIDLKRICILLESQDFIMEYLLANLYARTSSVCFIALVLAGKGLTKQSGVSCPLLGFYFFLIFIWKSFPTYRKLQEKKKNHQTVQITSLTLYPDSPIVELTLFQSKFHAWWLCTPEHIST